MVSSQNTESLTLKKCNRCKHDLPLSSFHKKKSGKFGVSGKCVDCVAKWQKDYYSERNKAKRLERQASEKYQLYVREFRLKNKYGINLEQYEAMLQHQGGVCAICGGQPKGGTSTKYFSVDHCHKTGKVRQLLCNRCNTALGLLNEDKNIVQAMANYIEKHNV
jgi:Recombination endonuclease VII